MVAHSRWNWTIAARQWLARRGRVARAMTAMGVAFGALLWHVLGCIDSPMAFSPNGDLAFVAAQSLPIAGEDKSPLALAGTVNYRLMLLPNGATAVRVLEETTDQILSAPCFSPDGRDLCYFRIPLLSPAEHKERAGQPAEPEFLKKVGAWAEKQKTAVQAEGLAVIAGKTPIGLPDDLEEAFPTKAELVIRDVASGEVKSATPLRLPLALTDKTALLAYLSLHPQWSRSDNTIYFDAGGLVLAVSPPQKKLSLVAAMVAAMEVGLSDLGPLPVLSPDGGTLAVGGKNTVAIIKPGDGKVVSKTMEGAIIPGGLAWFDDQTLAVAWTKPRTAKAVKAEPASFRRKRRPVEPPAPQQQPPPATVTLTVTLLRNDATVLRSVDFAFPGDQQSKSELLFAFAVARDGKHIVATCNGGARFFTSEGKLLGETKAGQSGLMHPTFSPDSSRVAFKEFLAQDWLTTAIVFYTPQGKLLSRVGLPKVQIPPKTPAATKE